LPTQYDVEMVLDEPTATVVAASVAAFLALANIATSVALDLRRQRESRRLETARMLGTSDLETAKWLRGELLRCAVEFVDAGFEVSRLSKRLAGGSSYEDQPPDGTRSSLIAAHYRLTSAQSAIRLLAPAELVVATEDCRDAHDVLFDRALRGEPRWSADSDLWGALSQAGRTSRAAFITLVRGPLGLEVYDHRIRHHTDQDASGA